MRPKTPGGRNGTSDDADFAGLAGRQIEEGDKEIPPKLLLLSHRRRVSFVGLLVGILLLNGVDPTHSSSPTRHSTPALGSMNRILRFRRDGKLAF